MTLTGALEPRDGSPLALSDPIEVTVAESVASRQSLSSALRGGDDPSVCRTVLELAVRSRGREVKFRMEGCFVGDAISREVARNAGMFLAHLRRCAVGHSQQL